MTPIQRFAKYAAAFEESFTSDDWMPLAAHFAQDSVYVVNLPQFGAERLEGRDAILAWFPDILNRFDRRFERRALSLIEGPREQGAEVWLRGAATYRSPGVPDFVLELEETVRFRGDEIVHLEDVYSRDMIAETERYLAAWGTRLGIVFGR